MNVPMKWLKEYVDIKLDSKEYASRMVMTGTGVESIEQTGSGFDHVVVGKVESIVKHPDSDHLVICQVNVGSEVIQIVTGAPNVFEGAYVPVALDGAHLPGGVKIKKGKLRGVVSNGMMCSGPELEIPEGLYPHCGDEGLLIFQEPHEPGTDVKEVFGLGDDVIEFEILANRPDCLSVWGLSRESAAVLGEHFVKPEISVRECEGDAFENYASVEVRDDELCPRYCARVIKNVKIGPSPLWMRAYLYGAGVRPINNIVDITNFVMLETGHPMHAFDLSKVKDGKIVVRRAHPGEELVTLDGKKHVLTEDMLVIADAQNATGLAGIMGGEESEIVSDTHAVLFECAAFQRANNRVTARSLGIRTEASSRYEKGVCPETVMEAIERACQLVNELECGEVVPGVFDHYPNPQPERVVKAQVSRIQNRISVPVPGETMADILDSLEIQTELQDNELTCRIPAFREDIETDADLSEEVLRLYGYEHIPSTMLKGETQAGGRSERQRLLDKVKNALVGMGGYEAMNFSFVSPKWLAAMGFGQGDERLDPVVVRNPLGEDTSVMRTSLAPSMLNTLSLNINRGNPEGMLFETAPIFHKTQAGQLPQEELTLCVGLYGDKKDFFDLKDIVTCMLAQFGISPTVSAGGEGYYHPGRKAVLSVDGTEIGQLGEVHPDIAAKFDIERRVYLAEIKLEAVKALEQPIGAVKVLPKFPAVTRDLALVVDEAVGVGPLMETIRSAAGKTLETISLFDVYRGLQLGQDKKSVAFALSFRAADRTLTDADINHAMERILSACEGEYKAEIRK